MAEQPDNAHPLAALHAAYLHARTPADARVALYHMQGPDAVLPLLPEALRDRTEDVEFEVLLPTDEDDLRPVDLQRAREGRVVAPSERPQQEGVEGARTPQGVGRPRSRRGVVPGVWRVPGRALRLEDALPWLVGLRGEAGTPAPELEPGLLFLVGAAALVQRLADAGRFAPAEGPLHGTVPVWDDTSARATSALSEIVPHALLTARFATHDDPVYAVTPRNLVVSFIGHALDVLTSGRTSEHDEAVRLPREFWHSRPRPVLEILVPEQELEEGVPWGIQLLLEPVPGLPVRWSMQELRDRRSRTLFDDPPERDALKALQRVLDDLAGKIPALHRAMNMADGKASLNRAELDQVLDHLPLLEAEDFLVTLPGLERMQRLSAQVRLVDDDPDETGPRPWFRFDWNIAIGDRVLSDEELDQLLHSKSPVLMLEDGPLLLAPRDRAALQEFVDRQGKQQRISFFEALRLKLGGAAHRHGLTIETLIASPRLERIVESLNEARDVEDRVTPDNFVGELRPYQKRGHGWLYFLLDQGFGACLADDMGLGKTVQAIAVMLDWRKNPQRRKTILLVCPVSVLGNWRRELHRFSPELRVALHHGKQRPRDEAEFGKMLEETDVLLTSYNLLQRDEELLLPRHWEGVILDEAQNIKNPTTRQSKAARALHGDFRLALTGTPLENRPLDLWSIMDFLNEGLLGNRAAFSRTLEHPIVKQRSRSTMSTLARLVRPFVLRRLKTDPEIITDLPEKSEQVVASRLTREQALLYESVVRKGMEEVENSADNMSRRGAILTTLLRLKQVCNHPAHYLADGSQLPGRSGKLDFLSEMLEEALDEGDRCLVFTQFKEMGTLLKMHLEALFGGTVLFLHGGTPQKEREEMVMRFQESAEDGPRIFVLSLKAGGTGLNLTAANRVFHFDRWWNPAVEDQATDRAFRIGQQRNVFVHKFACTGTLEERIQTMLERKRAVAESLLGSGESWLTELSNEELRRLLILDRQEALT